MMQYFQVPQAVSSPAYFWIGSLVPKLHLLRVQPGSNGSWCFETCQDMRRHASIDPLSISRKLMSSELYSGPSRALWELLQNADDCSYDQEAEMQIEQTGNYLWMLGSKKPSELLGMCWGLLIFLGSRSQHSPINIALALRLG